MNIFILDEDPIASAHYHCDKHVIKMITEYSQILSTVVWMKSPYVAEQNKDKIYKPTHRTRKCVKWAGENFSNLGYLYSMIFQLRLEHKERYGKDREHKAFQKGTNAWRLAVKHKIVPEEFQTPFVYDVNKPQYICENVIETYRMYYFFEKLQFCTWRSELTPPFINMYTDFFLGTMQDKDLQRLFYYDKNSYVETFKKSLKQVNYQ